MSEIDLENWKPDPFIPAPDWRTIRGPEGEEPPPYLPPEEFGDDEPETT